VTYDIKNESKIDRKLVKKLLCHVQRHSRGQVEARAPGRMNRNLDLLCRNLDQSMRTNAYFFK